jgi:FkbM family methyltransferase
MISKVFKKFFLNISLLCKRIKLSNLRYSRIERLFKKITPQSLVIDIGASYFPHGEWKLFLESEACLWILIDPNSESLAYSEKWRYPSSHEKIPMAVGGIDSKRDFFITNVPTGSSLFKPKIPEGMRHRISPVVNDYFFPYETTSIEIKSLSSVIARWDIGQPRILKLDTQGSELEILQGVSDWIKKNFLIGVEVEASLLATPLYESVPKFHMVQAWLEDQGFELLAIDVINAGFDKGHVTYPHECDAVFALRPDIASDLPIDGKLMLLCFYITNKLYQEALRFIINDVELYKYIDSAGYTVSSKQLIDELNKFLNRKIFKFVK